jgi:two-component system cell cycle response regulator DivK
MTKRILVVEDTEDNRQIIRDLRRHAPPAVNWSRRWTAEGVTTAERAARPDLDGHPIAGTDGYEATGVSAIRLWRKAECGHSYALSGDEAKTRAAGCDGYVAKPFSPRQLLAKVREFLP